MPRVRLQPAHEPLRHARLGDPTRSSSCRASLLVYLIPILAVACIGLLLSDRHPQQRRGDRRHADVLAAAPADRDPAGPGGLQPYLLSTQFNAWQGLLREPIDWAPIVRAAWVCALYALPALVAAYLVFLRRDVAGG